MSAPKGRSFAIGHRYWILLSGMKVAHMVSYSHERNGKGTWQFLCAPWVGATTGEMEESPLVHERTAKCAKCAEKQAEVQRMDLRSRDALVGARLRTFDNDLYRALMFPGPGAEDNDEPPEAA